MPVRCFHHPGRQGVISRGGRSYCQRCRDDQQAAARRVDGHVKPRECFVRYASRDNWMSIYGTGCAHWVAHQKRLMHRGAGSERCLDGYIVRIPDLVSGAKKITDLKNVKKDDIYVMRPLSNRKNHCGLVIAAKPDAKKGVKITIQHDSSEQGGVVTDDFHSHFKGKGFFYRG